MEKIKRQQQNKKNAGGYPPIEQKTLVSENQNQLKQDPKPVHSEQQNELSGLLNCFENLDIEEEDSLKERHGSQSTKP